LLEDNPPILISSTRDFNLDPNVRIASQVIRIGALDDKYIYSCIKRWIKTANPGKDLPNEDLLRLVASELHGYPLAARFASYIIVKYSLEEALSNLRYFQNIRIDMVKQLIGRSRSKLTDLQMNILVFLTFADTGLTQDDLRQLLGVDINELKAAINELVSYMFISIEEGRLQILSLMKDYFWRYAQSKSIWKNVAELMAFFARDALPGYDRKSEDFIHYCSMAYRLFLLCNRPEDASRLAYYFKGELREACIKLYHAKNYSPSLEYANKWLSMMPNDSEIRLFKARCLIRLDLFEEAEIELSELRKLNFAQEKVAHVTGLLYKNKGEIDKSIIYYKRGLDIRPDYLPLLRDYADALERKGDLKEALKIIKQADDLAPRDLYIGPKFVSIMKKIGLLKEALSKMEDLINTFPDVASFHHSASMLYSDLGDFEESYNHAKIAVSLDDRLNEAITHLASLELRKNAIIEANSLLDSLPSDINYNTKLIRDTIRAEMLLR
jgi:tetratricopeptide (TPR) repeat protein